MDMREGLEYAKPMAMSPDDGPRFGKDKGAARQLIVLVHGVGADGHDLIDLAPYLAPVAPNAAFFAPHGPEPYAQSPLGRQWFPIGDLSPAVLAAGIRRGQAALDEAVDGELARLGLGGEDLLLLGFSQGAMTALFAGLRRAAPPRGIVAAAGALVDPGALAAEIAARPPVLLTHGEADEVVPARCTREAARSLAGLDVPVETYFAPGLGHGIDEATLAHASLFVQRRLS